MIYKMTTYIEYGVTLSDGQKSKLLSAIQNKSPLTLRLKHSHLQGSDELMLTQRQIAKIQKSIANGAGSDLKISKTQITRSVKHGGNLFTSLISLGSKLLPYAIKGVSKAAPAIATGAATALGDIGIKKLFGKGITIPMYTTQELIPSLKPVYYRYKSGDIMKSAFGSDHGITSSKFWRRPTAAEESKKGIISKGSNPELFFKFEKPSRRMYKSTFFEKNPEALSEINNIILSNPDTWPQVLRVQYGIIVDEHFWENNPLQSFGSGVDIHKWIGKLPKPKAGWTPGKYKYMGPYNPLEKQLTYDPETGKVLEWKVKPYNKVDEIAAYHDICYDMGKNKGDCDKEMVQSLDQIPYGEMPKWGSTARFLINTKQKLGLGIQKNACRR